MLKSKPVKNPIHYQQSDLERTYYEHLAFMALHTLGQHIHFTRENE